MYCNSLYAGLIIKSLVLGRPLSINYVKPEMISMAKINKVLYQLGLYDERIRQRDDWQELYRRRAEQRRAIAEIAAIAETKRIDLMIVKTFKPFDYVPDDIDVLVIDENAVGDLVQELVRRGYRIRKVGTPEITLRIIANKTFVDIDIHDKLGAGFYEYIDKHYLWRRRETVEIDGVRIAKPNSVDELLITAAHAVLKELKIILADVLHVIISSKNDVLREALMQSRKVGLSKALRFLERVSALALQMPKNKREIRLKFPLNVPPHVIFMAYLENLKHRVEIEGMKPLKELAKTPSSKGIGILLRYVGL